MKDLLLETAQRAIRYREGLPQRPVTPSPEALERIDELEEPMPEQACDPSEVIRLLDDLGSPASLASAGGRFFGFVIGSSLPVTVAANWLATAWDQDSGLEVTAPLGARLESICAGWLCSLFSLPPDTGVGFVTGGTMANFTCLAAARHALLERAGWDVERQGLFAAPPITVIVGDEVHISVLKALSLLGLGRERVHSVPTDEQGRILPELLPTPRGPAIICTQVGHVATGACDRMFEICAAARHSNTWVHVDGAFGLWAAATPGHSHLVSGLDQADSWATDAHKWLNVPYDSGLALVKEARHLRNSMALLAPYLTEPEVRQPDQFVPELSRRARGIEVWAALKSLGRAGVVELVERCCGFATYFAEELARAGYEVLNQVVLNQVLVSFGSDDLTNRVISGVQHGGVCWCSRTVFKGRAAMRISVSSWATTEEDCSRSLEAILHTAATAGH